MINGQREFLTLWSCPVYPAGHPPRILNWLILGRIYAYVELEVYEPGIFNFRNESRLDVRLCDQSKQDWSLPGEYRWNLKDNSVIIQNDKNIDSLAGKKARVEIRFL